MMLTGHYQAQTDEDLWKTEKYYRRMLQRKDTYAMARYEWKTS